MDQVADSQETAVDAIDRATSNVGDPFAAGLVGDPEDLDSPRPKFDDEEDRVTNETVDGEHLDREEVRGRDRIPMHPQELLPRRTRRPDGGRRNAVPFQDPRDRAGGEVVTEVEQGAADPRVAPSTILEREPNDELLDRASRSRAAAASVGTAVVLGSDQPAVPSAKRVRSDDRFELVQHPTRQRVRCSSESAPFAIGERWSARSEPRAEDSVLLAQVLDDVGLAAAEPACEYENEEQKRVAEQGHVPSVPRGCGHEYDAARR